MALTTKCQCITAVNWYTNKKASDSLKPLWHIPGLQYDIDKLHITATETIMW